MSKVHFPSSASAHRKLCSGTFTFLRFVGEALFISFNQHNTALVKFMLFLLRVSAAEKKAKHFLENRFLVWKFYSNLIDSDTPRLVKMAVFR